VRTHILCGKFFLFFLDYQKKIAGLLAAREVLAFTSILDVAGIPAFLAPLFSVALAGVPAVLACVRAVVSFRIYCCCRRTCFASVLAFANVLGFAIDCVICDPPRCYA
jgi:hypothetical protein